MPTLILSGGTGKDKEKKLNNLFLKKVGKGKILYLPMARETKNYLPCLAWINSVLKSKNITMLTDLKEKINLNNFKGIYIGGGNTFKLLKEIKENKWESKLKNFKGIIAGGSA
ncbi:MAG: peptidase E, partial [Nanoarchaeota archaeon]|nr:peptidase E [Nanoarchaeota archaeon]